MYNIYIYWRNDHPWTRFLTEGTTEFIIRYNPFGYTVPCYPRRPLILPKILTLIGDDRLSSKLSTGRFTTMGIGKSVFPYLRQLLDSFVTLCKKKRSNQGRLLRQVNYRTNVGTFGYSSSRSIQFRIWGLDVFETHCFTHNKIRRFEHH